MTLTAAQSYAIRCALGEYLDAETAADTIRTMHERVEGAEILRAVVRDFPGSDAAERIISTLWSNL